jgi:hypothetical protein
MDSKQAQELRKHRQSVAEHRDFLRFQAQMFQRIEEATQGGPRDAPGMRAADASLSTKSAAPP